METLNELHMKQLINALPQQFNFYHLGRVELQPAFEHSIEDRTAISISLYGDIRAVFIFLFSKELEFSIYCELSNILASQLASQLKTQTDWDVMITPPKAVTQNQLNRITKSISPITKKTYIHFINDSAIPIEALILTTSLEEIGYA